MRKRNQFNHSFAATFFVSCICCIFLSIQMALSSSQLPQPQPTLWSSPSTCLSVCLPPHLSAQKCEDTPSDTRHTVAFHSAIAPFLLLSRTSFPKWHPSTFLSNCISANNVILIIPSGIFVPSSTGFIAILSFSSEDSASADAALIVSKWFHRLPCTLLSILIAHARTDQMRQNNWLR